MYVIDFLESGLTVNSVGYIVTLKHFRRHVCRVQQSTEHIILSYSTPSILTRFGVLWNHFFPLLKSDIKGVHFTMDNELKDANKQSQIKERPSVFFIDGMNQSIGRKV